MPAGHALAVDRVEFSQARGGDDRSASRASTVRREEVTRLDENDPDTITMLASGPLTSSPLAAELQRLTGADHLAFYDSISPIVDATHDRHGRRCTSRRGGTRARADYINCPFTKEEYDAFIDALATAEKMEAKEWEQTAARTAKRDRGASS